MSYGPVSYTHLYADHVLDVSRVVNLEANNKDINLVLSRVFDNMNVDYKIVDCLLYTSCAPLCARVINGGPD